MATRYVATDYTFASKGGVEAGPLSTDNATQLSKRLSLVLVLLLSLGLWLAIWAVAGLVASAGPQ